ncbi:MAG TPA: transglutaminase-like domain-containing protein [Armatimonadota bacterium]|nr:transglutaminase-like domain-containing protein [Armatimonadota bacterium]
MSKTLKAIAALALAAILIHSRAASQEIPSETWMGIYLNQAKIGYARFFIEKANFRGKPGYRLDSTTVTRVLALGVEVEQTLDTAVRLSKDFEPVHQVFKMSSAGHTTTVTAVFGAGEIVAEVTSAGTKSTRRIPIPAGSKIVGGDTFLSPAVKLKIGDKLNVKVFNPLTLTLDDLQAEVLRQEELELGGETHQAFVVKTITPFGEMICWQAENGNVLKVTALMGIVMIREPKEAAQSIEPRVGNYVPPSDLAVMTSAPTATEVPNPRQVKYMKIRLSGLRDRTLAISDRRQKVKYSGGERPVAVFEITASRFDPSKAAPLPIGNAEFKRFLAESPYVQPLNPEIAALARQVAGKEKNACAVVSRLRAWVNSNMEPKANIGIIRSSVDVLHAKTGVCRDYAVLYAALARAAGIPTKLVAGLVHWKDGFYYHAWAESFVGEWVPVDATLSTDFVDATHIKLAEGDATAMFDMLKTVGSLKAEILGFK